MAEFRLPPNSKIKRGKHYPVVGDASNVRCFAVYRYDPASGENPRMDTYEVECNDNWSYQVGGCRPSNAAYDFEDATACGMEFMVTYLFPAFFFTKFAGTTGFMTLAAVQPTASRAPELK